MLIGITSGFFLVQKTGCLLTHSWYLLRYVARDGARPGRVQRWPSGLKNIFGWSGSTHVNMINLLIKELRKLFGVIEVIAGLFLTLAIAVLKKEITALLKAFLFSDFG